ncbi:hypothetical protein LCGC14_1789270 [marine sediment metagenome]|uniref:Uncharacterized protein n=1 Tax=marine sediment metagenome TaxID=412755 RepID=A0A0F9GT04_9ZZZZ
MPTVRYNKPQQHSGHWTLYPKDMSEPSDQKWLYPFLHATTEGLLLRLQDEVLARGEALTVLEWDDYFRRKGLID